MNPVEIALIGCGAIAQNGYLPALAAARAVRCRWLVDANEPLARGLARRWHVPGAASDYKRVLDHVEAVVIATPNHLHAPMAIEALGRRKAVLCEKPLGRSVVEARRMVDVARQAGAVLIAGMTFRQYPGLQALQRALPWEALGAVRHVRARYGGLLDWPLASPYLFDRDKVGGGALIDQGVHLLDTLLWVLQVERASVVEAADDGASGIEAEIQARLLLRLSASRGEVPCTIEVSRLRRMANRIDVVGERATLVIPLSSTVMPWLQEQDSTRPAVDALVKPMGGTRCFAEQLTAFAQRARGLPAVCAEGESQLRVLELIEGCYRLRRPLLHPWEAYEPCPAG